MHVEIFGSLKFLCNIQEEIVFKIQQNFVVPSETELLIVKKDSPIATKVEVFNYDTQQYEAISLVKEGELPLLETAK